MYADDAAWFDMVWIDLAYGIVVGCLCISNVDLL